MMSLLFFAVLIPSLVSLLGTEMVRRYAIRTSMIDIPNHRSSHTVPTPRGGGIAMVAGILSMLAVLWWTLPEQRWTTTGLLGGGLFIATVGMLDDRYQLSAKLRLVVQFLAAGWFLFCCGGSGPLQWLGTDLQNILLPAVLLFLVWSTNVYNFMDGLDGFAGGQAVVAATAAALICLRHDNLLLAFTMLATSGAAAGFLVWNWPPAKIFMGDCGSGFLGFLFAATAVAAHKQGTLPMSAGLLLVLVFLIDATLTLLRRIAQGEPWYKPHRSHAYQLATQLGASHRQVTIVSLVLFSISAGIAIMATEATTSANILMVVYASAIVGLWLAINWLFVGRTQTIASIKENGQQPQQRIRAEFATVFYLKFTRFQSKLRFWRSIVPQSDLLSEATGVASKLGYTVSHDWLDGCGGGSVEAAGEKWILLDFNMTKRDQVRQILLTICDEANELETLSSEMKAALLDARSQRQLLRRAA